MKKSALYSCLLRAGAAFRLMVLLSSSIAASAGAEILSVPSHPNHAARANAFAAAPVAQLPIALAAIPETRLDVPAPSPDARSGRASNQIGFKVDIPVAQQGLPALASAASWVPAEGKRYALLAIHSPNAVSVRAGVVLARDFPGRVLSVAASGEVESKLEKTGELWWSSTSDGETLTLVLEVPEGYLYRQGDVTVPVVSYIDRNPLSDAGNRFANIFPNTASCNIDVACASSSVQVNASYAVMLLVFTRFGDTFLCSGTLLADAASSFKPYVYTANHCIDSPFVASSVISFWRQQYPACGAANVGVPEGVVKLSGGAQLLDSSTDNDHSFLLLTQPAPPGAFFAGWDARPLAPGTPVLTISHPHGDVKKVAYGNVLDPPSLPVLTDLILHQDSWNVDITTGTLEEGSSGGNLFTCDGQSCYLRGGLIGGIPGQVCTPHQESFYSRFDVAYRNIGQWLGAAPLQQLNCLFGWAEANYSSLLAPPGGVTQVAYVYTYRYYPVTTSYLGLSSSDNHLYFLGPQSNNALLDLGPVTNWYATAGCQ